MGKRPNNSPPPGSIGTRLRSGLTRLEKCRKQVLRGGGPETLHDFRVALRRLRTYLKLIRDSYPPDAFEPASRLLKGIAKRTNAFRDQEVLCAILTSMPLLENTSLDLERWLNSQEDLRRGLEIEVREYLGNPDLAGQLQVLPRILLPPTLFKDREGVRRVMARQFRKERRHLIRFLESSSRAKANEGDLHRLRVEAKRVRYALEEFVFLMPRRGRKVAVHCRKIQDVLGKNRDWDRARKILWKNRVRFHETKPWRKELRKRSRTALRDFRKEARAFGRKLLSKDPD